MITAKETIHRFPCMHALQALRESVQALEDKQPLDLSLQRRAVLGAMHARHRPLWRDVEEGPCRRGHAAAPMPHWMVQGATARRMARCQLSRAPPQVPLVRVPFAATWMPREQPMRAMMDASARKV